MGQANGKSGAGQQSRHASLGVCVCGGGTTEAYTATSDDCSPGATGGEAKGGVKGDFRGGKSWREERHHTPSPRGDIGGDMEGGLGGIGGEGLVHYAVPR
jgi:hypothetical protein